MRVPPQCITLLVGLILVLSIALSSCATTTAKYEEKTSKTDGASTIATPGLVSQLSEAVKGIRQPQPAPSTLKRQFRNDLSKRRPKFGLNFTMPGLTMSSIDTDTFLGPTGLFGGTNGLFGGTNSLSSDKTGSPNVLGDIGK